MKPEQAADAFVSDQHCNLQCRLAQADAALPLVHQRLDEMGVPAHADRTGEDRLGVRLMLCEKQMAELRAEVERLRANQQGERRE